MPPSISVGLFLNNLYVRIFFFQLAKFVLWPKQQRKLPIRQAKQSTRKGSESEIKKKKWNVQYVVKKESFWCGARYKVKSKGRQQIRGI